MTTTTPVAPAEMPAEMPATTPVAGPLEAPGEAPKETPRAHPSPATRAALEAVRPTLAAIAAGTETGWHSLRAYEGGQRTPPRAVKLRLAAYLRGHAHRLEMAAEALAAEALVAETLAEALVAEAGP
jgi:hypothetical protein